MDEKQLKRSYLESLTTHELVRIADSFGIDIPPSLERVFIIGELLDAASGEDAESEEMEVVPLEAVDFHDSVPLPKQYNITFIELLIRDPLWVFLFWEVKGSDREFFEKEEDFGGYCLRVSPVGSGGAVQRKNSFIVPVGNDDTAWYLGFPPGGSAEKAAVNTAAHAETRYQVELCAVQGSGPEVLAVSPLFTMPRLQPPKSGEAGPLNPLIRLSGAEDFRVIRNADRQPRSRYGIISTGGLTGGTSS
ncbi:DUF4912 domain-containing protein [Spirochaetia bacterium]|nr:DUF4912 domain-containing protein [Spirochaetia bacterium]